MNAHVLVLDCEKARQEKPLVVSLSNYERLALRQAQGERDWADLLHVNLRNHVPTVVIHEIRLPGGQ